MHALNEQPATSPQSQDAYPRAGFGGASQVALHNSWEGLANSAWILISGFANSGDRLGDANQQDITGGRNGMTHPDFMLYPC